MRDALMVELEKLASRDSKVLLLTGDHGATLFGNFQTLFPKQYINMGIAEQNMVGVSAGLARAGFRPFVYGLSAFIPIRVLEQIKLDVCHDKLPVVFLGDGAGLVYSQLGTSHQTTEDIAVTRVIPELAVFSPADKLEMIASINLAFDIKAPVYLRIGKSDVGNVHKKELTFNKGDIIELKESKGVMHIIATGSMVKAAMRIADEFPGTGVSSAPNLKPINEAQIIDICKGNKIVITIEEHSIYGGLGSIISEISSSKVPTSICKIGVNDRFSEMCGSHNYLLKEHSLDFDSIKSRIQEFLKTISTI